MSTLRRRYEKWCKDNDIEDCTHKQRYEESYHSMVKVLQQNTWRKYLRESTRATASKVEKKFTEERDRARERTKVKGDRQKRIQAGESENDINALPSKHENKCERE